MVKRTRYSLRRPKPHKALLQAPGTVTYVGRKEKPEINLEVIDYNKETFEQFTSKTVEDAFRFNAREKVTWFNIDGLSRTGDIEKLGNYFGLHPLTHEDIVNTNQRPKFEEYEDYLYIVSKMLYHKPNGQLEIEHISFVLGKDHVVSFQEADGDVFGNVRERLTRAHGRIRSNGSDYLLYALLDAIVDHYFLVMEEIADKIEHLEERLFENNPGEEITLEIQELKRTILRVRRAVTPMREVVSRLEKIEGGLIEQRTQNYIRDLFDHILQVSESIEIYREMTWGLMDMYMTSISHKMNEVMKMLTIIATIFIPLTFIAGIYGMNFENMPELHWEYSYYFLWGVMIILFVLMIIYFKRKKWL